MFSRIAILGMLLSLAASVFAEEAVQALHYEVGALALAGRSDRVEGLDSNLYGIRGEVTVPLAQYVGAALSGAYSRLHIKDNQGSCNMGLNTFGAQLFARSPTVGRVGLGYGHDKDASCQFYGGEVRTGSSEYLVFGEYYFEPVTLAFSHSRTEFNRSDFRRKKSYGRATWYATSNLSLEVAAGMEDAKDHYQATLAFQPALFGKSTSISVGYSKQRDYDYQSFMLAFSYFFDNRVDLKIRDRHFR